MSSVTVTSTMKSTATSRPTDPVTVRHASPVVAFIIGLAIIILASILNAAGLNLTKLDHVRTSSIPKASRRKDWARPLWLLGMLLYILSQLIGSTLALEYMRAEYVAPLGSTSLIFNFLFAKFLVGTPVTSLDIYGTIVVILGVIGIVAFGSINSGFATETDVAHLTQLWRRPNWLGYFFFMAFALILLFVFTSSLDAVLVARSDLSAPPLSGMTASARPPPPGKGYIAKIKQKWDAGADWVKEMLDVWTAAKSDLQIAWTLGIGWACCGGGLAGGCLVFAKAMVKLLSGSLSKQNPGNQFGHAAPIFTIILLVTTAVLQIICLNRGLKVYDSTLVVPVFYGIYTATGFLDSLVFYDEVDSYRSWTLFLIFVSILTLISGVVLLTNKKLDRGPVTSPVRLATRRHRKGVSRKMDNKWPPGDEEQSSLHVLAHGEGEPVVWEVGEASEEEDEGDEEEEVHSSVPLRRPQRTNQGGERPGQEGSGGNNISEPQGIQ